MILSEFSLRGYFNILNSLFVHINSHSNQLFLTAHLQKAHLKPFKSKAVTVSTVHYRHSSVAFHSCCVASLGRGARYKVGTQQHKYAAHCAFPSGTLKEEETERNRKRERERGGS